MVRTESALTHEILFLIIIIIDYSNIKFKVLISAERPGVNGLMMSGIFFSRTLQFCEVKRIFQAFQFFLELTIFLKGLVHTSFKINI